MPGYPVYPGMYGGQTTPTGKKPRAPSPQAMYPGYYGMQPAMQQQQQALTDPSTFQALQSLLVKEQVTQQVRSSQRKAKEAAKEDKESSEKIDLIQNIMAPKTPY
jgi:hypothetical protein